MAAIPRFFSRAQTFLATLGPVGLSPWAPGTMGSLVAVVFAPFVYLPFSFPVRTLILAGIFLLGSLCASQAEKELGQKDPGCVVIDELLGQWIVFLPWAELHWYELLAGFVLFRLFDILKPRPVSDAENWLPAGWGVMLDDVIAGLYGLLSLSLFLFFKNSSPIFDF